MAPSTIRKILSGIVCNPGIQIVEAIAKYFGVSVDALLSGDVSRACDVSSKPILVPVLKWEELTKLDELTYNKAIEWFPASLATGEEIGNKSFALKSHPSHAPRYPAGTILVIDPDASPENGDIVLFKAPNSDALGLRELLVDPPSIQLKSIFSDKSSIIEVNDDYSIIGPVIMSVYKKGS
mgnify:CR=1 FL=1